ncbi:MAG: hypothetical protein K2Q12_04210 [Rickettsiales bacterium]|nr:hypothetical protein [Rickettsiales bacterium]
MTHPLLFASVSAIMFVSASAHGDKARAAYDHLADGKVILASEIAGVSGQLPTSGHSLT